jgi:hypothetical protein
MRTITNVESINIFPTWSVGLLQLTFAAIDVVELPGPVQHVARWVGIT